LFRLAFLQVANHRVDNDHPKNHGGIQPVAHEPGSNACNEKHQDEYIGELVEQTTKPTLAGGQRQAVVPVSLAPILYVPVGQASLRATERRQGGLSGSRKPRLLRICLWTHQGLPLPSCISPPAQRPSCSLQQRRRTPHYHFILGDRTKTSGI